MKPNSMHIILLIPNQQYSLRTMTNTNIHDQSQLLNVYHSKARNQDKNLSFSTLIDGWGKTVKAHF